MEDLHITLIQSGIHWHKIEANLASFEEKIWKAKPSDIILLPEMFNTGFSMEARPFAERMNGKTFKWMRNMATQSQSVIIGSYLIHDGGDYYNRLFYMSPSGDFSYYDKRHLFRMTHENENFTPGKTPTIYNVKGWSINSMICYDLRFPVWSRNRFDKENNSFLYDVLIYIANWPAARIKAWDILLQARAVENMCYVAGLNRIGIDGIGISYNGHSNIIGPKGNTFEEAREDAFIKRYTLSAADLISYRKKFPSHMDFDSFELKP
jgi:predicted amidohydrolase